MTLRLILIRHAKSSWTDPFADDHARVLNRRGTMSATAIGEWMAKQGYIPDTIMCSDAVRTKQTADLVIGALGSKPKLTLSPQIYHAAPDTIIDLIQRGTVPTIAVIGHNPGMGMAANMLVQTAPEHRRFRDYPTCATTIIDFDADHWTAIRRGTGKCVDFTVPRDLIGTSGDGNDID